MDDDEELVEERIDDFGITFSRPAFWQFERESDTTYLYWDEDAGSMRVTTLRAATVIVRYLTDMFEKERAHGAEWRTIGERKGVAWTVEDNTSETRARYLLTGRDDVLILCSYTFDPDLYAADSELYAPAIDAGLEDYDAVLATLRF